MYGYVAKQKVIKPKRSSSKLIEYQATYKKLNVP